MKVVAFPLLTSAIPAVVFGLLSSLASAQTYEPAAFSDTVTRIEQSVTPPTLTEAMPVVSVYCQADVSTAGITSNVTCYERDGFDQVRSQTASAMEGIQITPAKVDGREVPVRMPFRVVFADRDGQPPVLLLPNLGHMQNTYGFHYSAPQERLDLDPWYESYSANSWSEGQMFFSTEGRLTRFLAVVNEQGEPVFVRRIEASKRNKRDAVELEKQLKETRFIPGMADGEPRRMQHVAVLHYPQS